MYINTHYKMLWISIHALLEPITAKQLWAISRWIKYIQFNFPWQQACTTSNNSRRKECDFSRLCLALLEGVRRTSCKKLEVIHTNSTRWTIVPPRANTRADGTGMSMHVINNRHEEVAHTMSKALTSHSNPDKSAHTLSMLTIEFHNSEQVQSFFDAEVSATSAWSIDAVCHSVQLRRIPTKRSAV